MRIRGIRWIPVLAAAVALAACGSSSSSSSSNTGAAGASSSGSAGAGSIKQGLKVAVIPKAINIAYFDAAYKGAQKAAGEIGATIEQVGPTQATGQAQLQFINTIVQQKYNVLVISAADADAIVPALKRAQQSGVTVVTYDADVSDPSARTAFVSTPAPDAIAKAQDKWISDAIGASGGEIAILSAAATAANQNTWIGLMKQDLAANYPQLKLVDTVYGNDDAATSAQKAAALLQSHPNLKGIISPTTVGVREAAKYLSGSQYKGKVQLTGLGLPSELKPYLKDGTVKTAGLWDPAQLGYVAVYAGATKASGGSADNLSIKGKSYTADPKGVIIGAEPQDFTASNVDKFAF
jgi:rhamnose transport system substrate-binding protein